MISDTVIFQVRIKITRVQEQKEDIKSPISCVILLKAIARLHLGQG